MKDPKPLSSQEFERRLKAGELKLCVVGMSNVGKTHWSKQLAKQGFQHLCCDDLIEQKLGDELVKLGFSGGIADMAKWLGQPYDKQFAANQQRYLDLEVETMQQIIDDLENGKLQGNTIIDTTGSVVHTHPEIRQKLHALTTVVYLEATDKMRHEMFKLYIAEPKPVVWEDIFKPEAVETNADALARCYPQLLKHRSDRYADMAHITIPREISLAVTDSIGFLKHLKNSLDQKLVLTT